MIFDQFVIASRQDSLIQPYIVYQFNHNDDGSFPENFFLFLFPDSDDPFTDQSEGKTMKFSFTMTVKNGRSNLFLCLRFDQNFCACFLIDGRTTPQRAPLFEALAIAKTIFVGERLGLSKSTEFPCLTSFLSLLGNMEGYQPSKLDGLHINVNYPTLGIDDKITLVDTSVLSKTLSGDLVHLPSADFRTLFKCLSSPSLKNLFNALLTERRIIFVHSDLSILTSCIDVIPFLIYPFTWTHLYIPILPPSLIHYIEAPTPFIIGILGHHYAQLPAETVEGCFIVNLNSRDARQTNSVLDPFPDEFSGDLVDLKKEPFVCVRKFFQTFFTDVDKGLVKVKDNDRLHSKEQSDVLYQFSTNKFNELLNPSSISFIKKGLTLRSVNDDYRLGYSSNSNDALRLILESSKSEKKKKRFFGRLFDVISEKRDSKAGQSSSKTSHKTATTATTCVFFTPDQDGDVPIPVLDRALSTRLIDSSEKGKIPYYLINDFETMHRMIIGVISLENRNEEEFIDLGFPDVPETPAGTSDTIHPVVGQLSPVEEPISSHVDLWDDILSNQVNVDPNEVEEDQTKAEEQTSVHDDGWDDILSDQVNIDPNEHKDNEKDHEEQESSSSEADQSEEAVEDVTVNETYTPDLQPQISDNATEEPDVLFEFDPTSHETNTTALASTIGDTPRTGLVTDFDDFLTLDAFVDNESSTKVEVDTDLVLEGNDLDLAESAEKNLSERSDLLTEEGHDNDEFLVIEPSKMLDDEELLVMETGVTDSEKLHAQEEKKEFPSTIAEHDDFLSIVTSGSDPRTAFDLLAVDENNTDDFQSMVNELLDFEDGREKKVNLLPVGDSIFHADAPVQPISVLGSDDIFDFNVTNSCSSSSSTVDDIFGFDNELSHVQEKNNNDYDPSEFILD